MSGLGHSTFAVRSTRVSRGFSYHGGQGSTLKGRISSRKSQRQRARLLLRICEREPRRPRLWGTQSPLRFGPITTFPVVPDQESTDECFCPELLPFCLTAFARRARRFCWDIRLQRA